MVERILPIEEEPKEEPVLVGLPEDTVMTGVAGDETVTSQRERERLKRVREYLARQRPGEVAEGVMKGVANVLPEPEDEEDLADLFEVEKQGIEKEDLSDIFEVTDEDVMGEDEEEEDISDVLASEGEEPEEEKTEEPHWSDEDIERYRQSQRPQPARKPVFKRTAKRYIPPAGQLGGTRE